MTLLGKIFTVLILIMSVLFLAFSIMVYATHTNWQKVVNNPSPASGEELGLRQKLEKQITVNKQLKEAQADLVSSIALEQAARRFALAALETKLKSRVAELELVQQELGKLTATEGTTAGALVAVQKELNNVTGEVKTLRGEIRVAQQDVYTQFDKVVTLTDNVNQLKRIKKELESRQAPLVTSVAALKSAMEKLGKRVEVSKDGLVRTDVNQIAPKVDGVVTKVGIKGLLEISIGEDDGIQVGYTLDVFRDNSYLGKVTVLKTAPDQSVVKIIPKFKQGPIKEGDRVATKFG